ncbi:universal stress protein [Acidithiobacillus sulfurivorans]|uniref:Universal stress protein n=1 Tax=Acidithiobacillus sulfurivorans TaxID=1958756 RepID=A0ABS6A2I5_9PROT|nr:universal stress protein [Acidithiobacillus sulfurivorans]MBU2761620.1 universal stress protein [Acidithiobacillus sulfurivorans]
MFQKVMVAYDGSASGGIALQQATEIAGLTQAELHLFGVIVNTGGMAMAQAAGAEDMLSREGEAIRTRLDEVATKLRTDGLSVYTHAVEGSPAEAIAQYARQIHADLLVIGHIPQFSFGHWLEGSVAKALLRSLPCSILVAKKIR